MSKPARDGSSRQRQSGPRVPGGTSEARRRAVMVLEVLVGMRTPTSAAHELGVSVPRYYGIESSALAGFVAACESRPRGRGASPESEIRRLRAANARLERSNARYEGLLRMSQRALGVSMKPAKESGNGKRRARRPVARALRAASKLKDAASLREEAASATSE